jgi:multicomponent K+:H+ antiporter subunit G
MSQVADVPLWAAIPIAFFLLLGAGLTLIGSFGLMRLARFYDRIHAPTLGSSWGTAGIVLASMGYFSVTGGRPVVHEFLLGLFVTFTTPITLTLLGRAAVFRDGTEGNQLVLLGETPRKTEPGPAEPAATED